MEDVATLAFGLRPKQGGCKVANQKRNLGVTSHVPGSAKGVREWTFTLTSELPCWELESQMDSQIFRARSQESKPITLKSSLYCWKSIDAYMSKMGLHCPFGHLKHKLWSKERPGVKLAIWLPTTTSQELTQFLYVQAMCNIPLESSQQGLQLFLKPHCNRRSTHQVMRRQNRKSPNYGNFGTPTWKSRDTLLEILGFATEIQLHATHATANLCSCIGQVAHDIQLHVTIRMQHEYTVLIYMFIYTY
jgi:hypothetical protein